MRVTAMENDTDQLEEQLEQAKEHLHRTLAEVSEKAEAVSEQLQPERLIERYPAAAVCAAAAAGFLLGTVDDDFVAIGLILTGGLLGMAGKARNSRISHASR
jgi:hypothetical protein